MKFKSKSWFNRRDYIFIKEIDSAASPRFHSENRNARQPELRRSISTDNKMNHSSIISNNIVSFKDNVNRQANIRRIIAIIMNLHAHWSYDQQLETITITKMLINLILKNSFKNKTGLRTKWTCFLA